MTFGAYRPSYLRACACVEDENGIILTRLKILSISIEFVNESKKKYLTFISSVCFLALKLWVKLSYRFKIGYRTKRCSEGKYVILFKNK